LFERERTALKAVIEKLSGELEGKKLMTSASARLSSATISVDVADRPSNDVPPATVNETATSGATTEVVSIEGGTVGTTGATSGATGIASTSIGIATSPSHSSLALLLLQSLSRLCL